MVKRRRSRKLPAVPSSPPTRARKALGRRIAELRALRGVTQEQFAHAVGLTVRAYAGIEGGASTTTETLETLARALGVELADLFQKGPVRRRKRA